MKDILTALKKSLKETPYITLAVSNTLLMLVLYYATLVSNTPWEIFLASNSNFYIFAQILLSIFNALLIGVVLTMVIYVIDKRRKDSNLSFVQALGSLLFSVAATGCTVCGAVLLPTLGIAASLAALPLAGLEVKLLTILLLSYTLYEYSKIILGKCDITIVEALNLKTTKGVVTFDISKKVFGLLRPFAVLVIFYGILLLLPNLPKSWRVDFSRTGNQVSVLSGDSADQGDDFTDAINPIEGYDLNVSYNDIGPKTVSSGAIDLEQFKDLYANSGQPLTDAQLKILTEGSDESIVIDRDNSYFLLNFFWGFGLANQNKILTEGEIAQYGDIQVENFSSTGGWSLASKEFNDYYSATPIITLTDSQQKLVEEVSSNIYRPCCGNSTAFPDCNHGMALLGVLEVMASGGASEDEMYEASKYINAYWFPTTYNDLAMYYKATEDLDYKDIDAKEILGLEFSSSGGYSSKKQWMEQEGILPEPPATSGGGCGV